MSWARCLASSLVLGFEIVAGANEGGKVSVNAQKRVSSNEGQPAHPCSLPSSERRTFLDRCSWERVREVCWMRWIGGVIEMKGRRTIACFLPPFKLFVALQDRVQRQTSGLRIQANVSESCSTNRRGRAWRSASKRIGVNSHRWS